MPSKKRASASDNGSDPAIKVKMHQTTLDNSVPSPNDDCWTVSDSLLIYNHPNVKPSSKILSLDMDGTLICTASGKVFAKDLNDWKIINDKVIGKLQTYHNQGFKIVIMSNQSGVSKGHVTVKNLQIKVQNIIAKLGLPIQGFFALLSDNNRKPSIGMWKTLQQNQNGGVTIDKSVSIYCGDAAGRPAQSGRKKDHSCGDRLFALNLGIRFMTPEELWFDQPASSDFSMPAFDPRQIKSNTAKYPTLTKAKKTEIVLMVGFPGSGKSYFCRSQLAPLGYAIISRDTLGTIEKCIQEAKKKLNEGEPVAIDNTNVDPESRSRFIQIAKDMGCPARCFVMKTTIDQALHNERYRCLTNQSHKPISSMIYNMMKSKYKQPDLSEGFVEILDIPFVFDPKTDNPQLYCSFLVEK